MSSPRHVWNFSCLYYFRYKDINTHFSLVIDTEQSEVRGKHFVRSKQHRRLVRMVISRSVSRERDEDSIRRSVSGQFISFILLPSVKQTLNVSGRDWVCYEMDFMIMILSEVVITWLSLINKQNWLTDSHLYRQNDVMTRQRHALCIHQCLFCVQQAMHWTGDFAVFAYGVHVKADSHFIQIYA